MSDSNATNTPIIHTGVVEEPLDVAAITARAADPRCGAQVTFLGVVRNHDAGESVTAIEYSAHPLAARTLASIAQKAAEDIDVTHIEAWHRIGTLTVGDAAMVVITSAPHRAAAYEANRRIVEDVKKELQVWKRQHFSDGSQAWSGI